MKMRLKKKIILIVTATVLAVALLALLVVELIKNVGPTVLSLNKETALPGDSVSYRISVDKNHGMCVGQIILEYNPDVLEFVSCANGDVFLQCSANGNEIVGTVVIIVNHTGIENTKKDGNIATVNFNVKNSSPKGEYPVKFFNSSNVEDGTYFARLQDFEEEKWIVPKFVDGSITVK